MPALAADPRFATNSERVAHRDALTAELSAALAARPAVQWAAALSQARVPAGVVNDIAGAFALAESLGLAPVVEVPSAHPAEAGAPPPDPVRLTRNPINLSRTPPRYRSGPPPLGEAGSGDG